MDNIEYENIMNKLGEIVVQNKQLKRANINLKHENKSLRRIINKRNKTDKQHYKNGRRGTNKNG